VSYPHAVPITAAATVDRAAPQTAGAWRSPDNGESAGQLVAGPSQVIVLRWDFAGIGARTAPGWGVLALYTASVLERRADLESFTELRVAEILAGDRSWTAADVKWDSFLGGRPEWAVINEQPMIDVRPAAAGTRTLIPVSPPVLERLLDGRSKGLAISSHGGVVASFAAGDDAPPTLYFDATPGTTTQTQEGHPENDRRHRQNLCVRRTERLRRLFCAGRGTGLSRRPQLPAHRDLRRGARQRTSRGIRRSACGGRLRRHGLRRARAHRPHGSGDSRRVA
jgi:hypothetical protein